MQLATLMPYNNDRVLIMSDHKDPSVQNIKRSPTESPWKTWGPAMAFLALALASAYLIKWGIDSRSLKIFKRSIAILALLATILAYFEKLLKFHHERYADIFGTVALLFAIMAAGVAVFV